MAAYAAFKHVELYNIGSGKRRVLKPPGGGSSDIFAGDVASTPRSMKNHMKSNIFQAPSPVNTNNNGEGRRPYVNSHNRLFGDNERSALTPGKNHLRSNIPIGGGDEGDALKAPQHSTNGGSYDQIPNENGYNGKSNGGGDYNECHHSHATLSNFNDHFSRQDIYKAAHYLNPTYNSKINLCINDDYISVIDNDSNNNDSNSNNDGNNSSAYETKEANERESNELDENMNLINAIRSNVPKNLAVVNDTSSKSVVSDNNVILKNRVPPGGYASALW